MFTYIDLKVVPGALFLSSHHRPFGAGLVSVDFSPAASSPSAVMPPTWSWSGSCCRFVPQRLLVDVGPLNFVSSVVSKPETDSPLIDQCFHENWAC